MLSSRKEPELEVHFEEADDDSVDSSIQAIINEIRKEASRMDLVMALDQIQSLRNENFAAETSLRLRAMEIKQGEKKLDEMEELVSSLTMERDLLQADTTNLREDISTLVDRIFEISCVAGSNSSSEVFSPSTSIGGRTPTTTKARPSSKPILRDSKLSCIPISVCKSKAFGESEDHSRPITLRSMDNDSQESMLVRGASVLVAEPNALTRLARKQIIEPKKEHFIGTNPRNSGIVAKRELSPLPTKVEKGDSTLDLNCFEEANRRQQKQEAESEHHKSALAPKRVSKKLYRMLCRNYRKLSCCARSSEIAAMRDEVDQLQSMIKLSLSTSEQLRNRLAIMSHYCDGTIHRLRGDVANLTAEKARMEEKSAIGAKENHMSLQRQNFDSRQPEEEIGRRELSIF